MTEYRVGQAVHGFAGGVYGRDSYSCRRIEHVGPDYVVTRNLRGEVELAMTRDLDRIDVTDRTYCNVICDAEPATDELFEGFDVPTLQRLAAIFPDRQLDLQLENARWHLDRAYEASVAETYRGQVKLLGAAKRYRDGTMA